MPTTNQVGQYGAKWMKLVIIPVHALMKRHGISELRITRKTAGLKFMLAPEKPAKVASRKDKSAIANRQS